MDELIAFLAARLDEDEADIDTRAHDSGQCDYLRGVHLEPKRALREVEAKRAILADYEERRSYVLPEEVAAREALAGVLRALAAVWSDHADYRQAVS